MKQPTLYLMLGYPGAGKTETAKMIAELTGAARLTSDDKRAELFSHPDFSEEEHGILYTYLDGETEAFLREGKDVIYDANLNRYVHRQEKYEICRRAKARPVLIWMKTPRHIAKDRAIHDSRHHLVPPHETPGAMFERIASIIEEPRPNENPIILDGTSLTKEQLRRKLGL